MSIMGKVQAKANVMGKDANKFNEVVAFMERRSKEGDVIAEEWVKDIHSQFACTSNVKGWTLYLTLGKKFFTEKNRIAVNATIQRNYRLENFISVTDWENKNFDLSII